MADARQDDKEYDEAAVHTTHEGQRTDMSNFVDQVTMMMRSRREPRSLARRDKRHRRDPSPSSDGYDEKGTRTAVQNERDPNERDPNERDRLLRLRLRPQLPHRPRAKV